MSSLMIRPQTIATFFGLTLGLGAMPVIAKTVERVLVISPVYWEADAPCDAALEIDFDDLPGGSLRDRASETEDGDRVFRPSSGGRIIIQPPEIVTYDVFGEDYAAVYTDLVERQPLAPVRVEVVSGTTVTVAMIETQVAFSSMMEIVSGPGRETDVTLLEEEFTIRISPRISLARWVEYDAAARDQQSLWDRARCENIHHELGHLLITAQLFEERMGDAFALNADSSEELSAALEVWFNLVIQETDLRQMRYHQEIRRMGVAAANKRPYRELAFPWLNADTELTD